MSKRKVSYLGCAFFKYLFLAASGLSWGRRDRVVPETEPAAHALEGGFFTTGPPGKSHFFFFFLILISLFT